MICFETGCRQEETLVGKGRGRGMWCGSRRHEWPSAPNLSGTAPGLRWSGREPHSTVLCYTIRLYRLLQLSDSLKLQALKP